MGERKENPDLAIELCSHYVNEVILTSGNLQKLEKHRRFGILEVWFWEDRQLKIYYLQNETYQEVSRSQLLPGLDLDLLLRCVQMPSRLEAMKAFMDALRQE